MAIGPFARIFAQVAFVTASSIGKAVASSFREAASRGAQQSKTTQLSMFKKMSPNEACKILNIEEATFVGKKVFQRAEVADLIDLINKNHDHFEKLNKPEKEFVGSPYIVSKVNNASKILKEHVYNNVKDEETK